MPQLPFADYFLTGSLLTILMPLALLIAIAIWYVIAVRRVPADTPEASLRPSSQDPMDGVRPDVASDVPPSGGPTPGGV